MSKSDKRRSIPSEAEPLLEKGEGKSQAYHAEYHADSIPNGTLPSIIPEEKSEPSEFKFAGENDENAEEEQDWWQQGEGENSQDWWQQDESNENGDPARSEGSAYEELLKEREREKNDSTPSCRGSKKGNRERPTDRREKRAEGLSGPITDGSSMTEPGPRIRCDRNPKPHFKLQCHRYRHR